MGRGGHIDGKALRGYWIETSYILILNVAWFAIQYALEPLKYRLDIELQFKELEPLKCWLDVQLKTCLLELLFSVHAMHRWLWTKQSNSTTDSHSLALCTWPKTLYILTIYSLISNPLYIEFNYCNILGEPYSPAALSRPLMRIPAGTFYRKKSLWCRAAAHQRDDNLLPNCLTT